MPGPLPKPKERRQGHRTRQSVELVVGTIEREVPPVPSGVLKVTRVAWERYWQSPVAEAVDQACDMPAIERLFSLYDMRERAHRALREQPTVEGSQGQRVLNPAHRILASADPEIRQLEDRLGMTPRSRAALGITLSTAKKSLDELARNMNADEDEADPRLAE